MIILSIETSCDETSAALVQDGVSVLSHVVSSSSKLFEETGGVVPEVAARKQLEYILPVLDKTFSNTDFNIETVNAIAVTTGPGLIGSLFVGVNTAKTLSLVYEKPIIPVNHLLGHLYSVFIQKYLEKTVQTAEPVFPLIALIVSGGHTDLIYMKDNNILSLEYLGGTRDDAAGEAFDKVARVLGIDKYLGGPKLSKLAQNFSSKNSSIEMPRPLLNSDDYQFSFSGLKTAVINTFNSIKDVSGDDISEIAYAFEQAVVDVLVTKTKKAVNDFNAKSLIVAGGVSANSVLREKMISSFDIPVIIPSLQLTGDNAAMIGCAAYYLRHLATKDMSKIQPDPSLSLENLF